MEIVKGIHRIDGIRGGNCYLVVGDELTLIDTGFSSGAKKIIKFLEQELERSPSELKTIVLTHSHYDHVGGASALRQMTGAKVAAHPDDAGFIEGTRRPPRSKGAVGILVTLLSPLVKAKKVKVDLLLNDGDTVGGMKVVHVPGHTLGSIALVDHVRKVVFSGDALTYRNGKIVPPPRGFTLDAEQAKQSISKIGTLEFDTMLAGHGEPLTPNASVRLREFLTALSNGSKGP